MLENPVLFFEISRVKCGVAKCVLPQQVFTFQFVLQELRANNVERVESKILEHLKNTREYRMVVNSGLKVHPYIAFINRILSKPTISPDIQFFVHRDCEREFDVMREIEMRALNGSVDFEEARERLVRIEGKMLGYPECCTESYIRSKRDKSSLPAESRVILEGIESGLFDDVLDAFVKSEVISLPQFFTSGFYPCSVGCRKAAEVGRKVEHWLGDVRDLFRIRCMINALHAIVTGYKASKGKGEFSERIRPFYSGIESKKLELIKTVQPHITNLTAFTNLFIRRMADSFFENRENQKN